MMDQDQYIKERVEDQRAWYSKKSAINKKYYTWFRGLIISLSAVIPLLAGFMGDITIVEGEEVNTYTLSMRIAIAVLGGLVAVLSGIAAMMKFHEKWVIYRTSAEFLRQEKVIFETGTGRYKKAEDPFDLFVQRVEAYLASEHEEWSDTMQDDG